MRKKLLISMLPFLAFAMNAQADNVVIDDVSVSPGGQAEATVRLQATSNAQYAGWQMDISLPDGISAVSSGQGLQGQLGDCYDETFTLNTKHRSNGIDRWLAFSASAHTISVSGDDILFTFPITADETLTAGTTLTATVRNIIFTSPQGTEDIGMDDVTFNITIGKKPQPWVFDLQACIDSVATSAYLGTASNPVLIKIPNEYLITSPIIVHDKVFIRLTGGTLKLSSTFATSNDYVFLIEGGLGSKSTLFLKDVTVDANSRALHYSFFKIQGDLYVESGVTYKNINTQTGKDNGAFYLNEGTLYIHSGTLNVAGNPIRGGGYTYIKGGVLKGSSCVNMNGNWTQGDRLGSGPSVEISGGELTATDIAIIPLESTYSGGATISGGKITAPTLINDGSYCRLHITGGILDITHLIKLNDIHSISGSEVFVNGNVDLNVKMNIGLFATSTLTKPWLFDCSITNFNTIYLDTGGLHYVDPNAPFEEKTLVVGYDYQLQKADFEKMTFTGVPDTLEVYYDEENYSVKVRLKDHSGYEGMLGDVNEDGVVSISDAVCIISWLQENIPPVFVEGAADYNKDGNITVSDALAIIQSLLNDTRAKGVSLVDFPKDNLSMVSVSATSPKTFDVTLQNDAKYTAFTMDVVLPEGETLKAVTLNPIRANGHQLAYSRLADGKYRVIAYSTDLNPFDGCNGGLLRVETSGTTSGKVTIDNIHVVDLNSQEFTLNATQGNTTGINPIKTEMKVYVKGSNIVVEADQDMQLKIYTATGFIYKTLDVNAGHNVFGDNATGIYIIKNKKITIK